MFTRTRRDLSVHRMSFSTTAAAALAACAGGGFVSAQTFHGLGLPPGAASSASRAVSADGSVVVGDGGLAFSGVGFRWSVAGGMQNLGTFPGGTYSFAPAVSGDGLVVTGYGDSPNGQRAYRWTSAGGFVDIGGLPGATQVLGSDANADGSVLVGTCNAANGYRAFRWTRAGGMVSLGTLPGGAISFGYSVNSDGSVVVGDGYSPIGDVAFRWTSAGGMQNLGALPGGTFSFAYAVSADGLVVVGDSDSPSGDVAYRWTAGGGMVSLGTLPGGFAYMVSNAVSADGSVIVGGVIGPPDTAFLWSVSLGIVDLNTYLPTLGINLTGWTLTDAGGVSADGQTIVGTGIHNGVEEAWIATLPGASATPFCFGDGSGVACPCGNSGSPGHGCENSSTTGGALLTSSGATSLSSDTFVLTASGERPTAFSIFLQGNAAVGPLNYGDGLRCAGGTLKRLYSRNAVGGIVTAPQGADPSISTRSASLGDPIPVGGTRDYQVYYRDPSASFCPAPPGNTWNIGNALQAVWNP
jgi:probable HAF family extracellular repeat protein